MNHFKMSCLVSDDSYANSTSRLHPTTASNQKLPGNLNLSFRGRSPDIAFEIWSNSTEHSRHKVPQIALQWLPTNLNLNWNGCVGIEEARIKLAWPPGKKNDTYTPHSSFSGQRIEMVKNLRVLYKCPAFSECLSGSSRKRTESRNLKPDFVLMLYRHSKNRCIDCISGERSDLSRVS
jgi:hypothetical protein